jgi:ABC-type Fe3+-siderophore transport system permease subunit
MAALPISANHVGFLLAQSQHFPLNAPSKGSDVTKKIVQFIESKKWFVIGTSTALSAISGYLLQAAFQFPPFQSVLLGVVSGTLFFPLFCTAVVSMVIAWESLKLVVQILNKF